MVAVSNKVEAKNSPRIGNLSRLQGTAAAFVWTADPAPGSRAASIFGD